MVTTPVSISKPALKESSTEGSPQNSEPNSTHQASPRSRRPRHSGHHKFEIKATGDAAKSYDFRAVRPPGKRTTVIESIGHLVKSCLGGGVVAIHESYKQCGLWTSVVLTVILGICVSYCMYMLARSAQKMYGRVQVPAMSYPDLAEAALMTGPFDRLKRFSRCFRYAVDFTIGADLFGSCCVYQVMISRTIKQLVENTDEITNEGNPPVRVYIAALLIPCILICMITSLKYLAPFSIVADIFILAVASATVYYAVKQSTMSPLEFPAFKTVAGLFEFVGVCVFSMEGVGVTLAIENNMEEPKKIAIVLVGGMSIVVSIVMTIGFFGYWGFGERSKSPVTVNFPLEPYAVDFTIGADLFGSCCVYQVMISRTIKQLVENTDEITNEGNPPVRVYIAALLIPCILICMITSLKYLAPFSIVADIFILAVASATVYYAVKQSTMSPLEFPAFKTVAGLFEFVGVCVFSMEGVGVTLAIENNMEEPKKIAIVLVGGMSIVVSIVMTIGFFGYWGFGERSKSPVTVNFPLEPFPIVLKVFMALMIYVTFALNFWIPFDLVWYYIKQRYDPAKYWLWERVYRAIFVVIITTIAVIFPNVSKFIGLLGSFCLSNMGFIYPAFIELCLDWHDPGLGVLKWRLWKFIVILIFGTVLCIVGTYTNAKELIAEVF